MVLRRYLRPSCLLIRGLSHRNYEPAFVMPNNPCRPLCSKGLCPPDGACQADATMRGRVATRHAALDGFQHVVADIVADPVG